MTVLIGSGLVEMLEREAWRVAPEEACALLLGSAEEPGIIQISSAVISPNVTEGNLETTFEIDPTLHLQLQKLARVGGPSIVGVWHSHPGGIAQPSEFDKASSVEPGWVWLISAIDGDQIEMAAFQAGTQDPHQIDPAELTVTD